MATVSIVLSAVSNRGRSGLNAVMPIPDSRPSQTQSMTSSGASQLSTVIVPADTVGAVWTITASGGNVWVKFARAPTAAAGADWLVLDGQTRDFGAAAGDKCAIIDG